MDNNLKYSELIKKINNYEIEYFRFQVNNYTHYNNCIIRVEKDILNNGSVIHLIFVNLTKDGVEDVSFFKVFNEEYKLFKLGRKGTVTLKQMWEYITVIEIK